MGLMGAIGEAAIGTSRAAGKAWLARIAARQVDGEPPASPQVAAAQLGALKAWGQVTGERHGHLRKIPQRTLVVNGRDDILVPTVNSFILQQKLPDARLILFPDFQTRLAFSVSRGVCRSRRQLYRPVMASGPAMVEPAPCRVRDAKGRQTQRAERTLK
jgi:hypothetical protein